MHTECRAAIERREYLVSNRLLRARSGTGYFGNGRVCEENCSNFVKKAYRDRFDDEIGRSFRDHDFKLQLALDMLMREFPDALPGERAASVVMNAAGRLSSLKQVSLYVDYDSELGWFDPNKTDYQNVAAQQIRFAQDLITRLDAWLTKI